MELIEAEQQRTIRLYKWSLEEMQREMEQGFPLLQGVQNVGVYSFLRFVNTQPAEEVMPLAVALVKRSHRVALRLLGEVFTHEEEALIAESRSSFSIDSHSFGTAKWDRFRSGPKLDKQRLTSLLKEKLSLVTGAAIRRDRDAGEWFSTRAIGDWEIETRFRVVPKTGASYVECNHLINRRDMPIHEPLGEFGCLSPGYTRIKSHGHTNYLQCLGIWSMHWNTPSALDEEPCAESLALICTRFLDALPTLLNGLGTDD